MKKITQRIRDAFYSHKKLSIDNTMTDGESIWLHGNKIIERKSDGAIYFTLAGWNTLTTRERINGILGDGNKLVYTKKGQAYIKGEYKGVRIESREWIPLDSCNSN